MRLVAAASLIFFGLTAYGQRGAAHGGFSGHTGSSFHAGGGGFGRSGYAAAPRYGGPARSYGGPARGYAGPAGGYAGPAGGYAGPAGGYAGAAGMTARSPGRQGFRASSSYRGGLPNRVAAGRPSFYSRAQTGYGFGAYGEGRGSGPGGDRYGRARLRFANPGYGYGFLGYSDLGDFLEYPDDFDNSAQPTQAYADAPYPLLPPVLPPDQGEPYGVDGVMPPAPQPAGGVGPQVARATPAPFEEEDAVTIVFKDGRPSEQIRNYALTRTALYVPGKHMREIPVDQIDLPATEKVNREAGVDFALPQAQ